MVEFDLEAALRRLNFDRRHTPACVAPDLKAPPIPPCRDSRAESAPRGGAVAPSARHEETGCLTGCLT